MITPANQARATGLARLAGASRYQTAVVVAPRALLDGSVAVYLARDRLGDALAGLLD